MSITNESLLKTTRGPKLKVLEPLCNQTVNLETDDKTLYCSLMKLKYRLSSVPKAKVANMERFNCMHASSNNSHRKHTNRIFYKKIFKSINGSLHPTGHMS